MQLTFEQNKIIQAEEDTILVLARAGTGKTTTLIEYTKKRPLQFFLYLTYNSAIEEFAKKRFGNNTHVYNIHALAFKEIGVFYKDKIKDKIYIKDVLKYLELNPNNQEHFSLAFKVLQFLENYFNSVHEDLRALYAEDEVLDLAEKYFDLMQDVSSPVPMTHDGYLKLYQLTDPILEYERILVDEAQDMNPVFYEIVRKQKTKKMYVGDNYQEIYSYMNTINVFNLEEGKKYYLTKSFRFGENIALVANRLMFLYKRETREIKGLRKKDQITFFDNSDKYTIITRTNAYLFDLAAKNSSKKIHIIGGEKFVFQEIIDAMNLYKGDLYKIKNPYIKDFKTFERLKDFSKNDQELIFLVKIIEKYSTSVEEIIEKIKKSLVAERNADIVLTTAHKSKGLEFFNVRIGDDFVSLFNGKGERLKEIKDSELHVYYVAITRAIESIELNHDLSLIFD